MSRWSVSAGPRFLLEEFGRISLFSTGTLGFVHDKVTHDYTFASPLFAPQTRERPVSGGIAGVSLAADIQIVTNLRLGWSGELWQGSGGIGRGVSNYAGLRVGVGGGNP
jgi:hypothetical protein